MSFQKVYIVSKEFTRRVLTEERSFSFEHGLADVSPPSISTKSGLTDYTKMMSINWIFHVHGGSFFRDMDSLVRDLLTKRLEKIAPRCRYHEMSFVTQRLMVDRADHRDVQYGRFSSAKPQNWRRVHNSKNRSIFSHTCKHLWRKQQPLFFWER